jgi:hypothetical protein
VENRGIEDGSVPKEQGQISREKSARSERTAGTRHQFGSPQRIDTKHKEEVNPRVWVSTRL